MSQTDEQVRNFRIKTNVILPGKKENGRGELLMYRATIVQLQEAILADDLKAAAESLDLVLDLTHNIRTQPDLMQTAAQIENGWIDSFDVPTSSHR